MAPAAHRSRCSFLALLLLFAWLGSPTAMAQCSVVPPAGVDVNSEAYQNVVDDDAFCCDEEWDEVCQAAYDAQLDLPCSVVPPAGVDVNGTAYQNVVAEDFYCCYLVWDEDCQELYDAQAVGVAGVSAPRASWKVFPNPSKGDITVQFEDDAPEAWLELVDVTGRSIVLQWAATGPGVVVQLDLHGRLAPGTYLLRVEQRGQRSARRILVR